MVMVNQTVVPDEDEQEETARAAYARAVGSRLRAVRKQMRLSLQAVEAMSDQEFKASVLGAYERGERAISVPRLQRLAKFYRVPVDQLLPVDEGEEDPLDDVALIRRFGEADTNTKLDLAALDALDSTEAETLSRYVQMIQVQRQDF